MMISVVICSIDPVKFAAVSRQYAQVFGAGPFEIIHIPDARSLAEGYNRGVARSRGDVIVFSHDDIEILTPDLRGRLLGHLEFADLLGVAGTTRLRDARWVGAAPPYVYGQIAEVNPERKCFDVSLWGVPGRRVDGIQAMDGVFLCAKRAVVDAVPFDAETFDGFHCYDIDFTFRAHLAGKRLAVCNDIHLIHASAGSFDDRWAEAARRLHAKHETRLASAERREFRTTIVRVHTREQIIEVMTPPHWK
jgi:GT2 family glycosyltransferase